MSKIARIKDNLVINKEIGIPYYYQLKQFIIKEIESNRWKSGQQILPEMKICEKLDISRTVVRQTIQELVNEGYLIKKKAKSAFIAEPKINENLVQRLMGFYEDMTARGFKIKNDILKQELIKAPEKIANLLNLKENEKVIIINRLRRLNSEPIVLVATYIPYKMCPDLLDEDMTDKSLYEFLEGKYKFVIDRGRRFIEAVMADEREAKLLNIKKGSPLVLIESISYLKDGRAIEYYHAVHRGDRSRFVVELRRTKSFGGEDERFPRTFSSGMQIKTKKIK